MSLRSGILEKTGDSAGFHEMMRCCALFFRKYNRTLMDRYEIFFGIEIIFSGDRRDIARFMMNERYSEIISNPLPPANFEQNKRKIKSVLARYGKFKLNDNFIYCLDGIYEDIPSYEITELSFKNQYTMSEILFKCIRTAGHCGVKIVRPAHFEFVHEVLSPNHPLEIIWNIGKTKEDVLNFQKMNGCRSYKFSKDFYERMGFNT